MRNKLIKENIYPPTVFQETKSAVFWGFGFILKIILILIISNKEKKKK